MWAPALVQGPDGCAWMVLHLIICNTLAVWIYSFLAIQVAKKKKKNIVEISCQYYFHELQQFERVQFA